MTSANVHLLPCTARSWTMGASQLEDGATRSCLRLSSPARLLHCFDEWLSFLDDIRGKLSRITAANIPRRVDRSGPDEQALDSILPDIT
jgi:hypothetical protein